MDTTIRGLQAHFDKMYSLRNSFVNGSFHERGTHMQRRVGRIYDSHRKNMHKEGRLARGFSYFMSMVNYFGGRLDLQLGMMEKFPSTGCLYCGHLPCICTETRPDPTQYQLYDMQKNWTLSDWQNHMQAVYGHNNIGKFEKAFGRLASEVGEFGILNANGPGTPIRPSDIIIQTRREAADILSWLLTIAYVQEFDLEKEIVARFTTCPGCKQEVCDCPLVGISADGKTFSTTHTIINHLGDPAES